MEIVAQHLQDEALRRSEIEDRDQFGRSAFNRYYYASFTHIQRALRKHRSDLSTKGHAALPRILRENVTKELKAHLEKGKKTGDVETTRLCSDALVAAKSLASILETGYATRVAADYYPDIAVEFISASQFRLKSVTVSTAHSWPSKSVNFVRALERAWRQIDAQ